MPLVAAWFHLNDVPDGQEEIRRENLGDTIFSLHAIARETPDAEVSVGSHVY
jgi:hypothetical protein